MQSYAEYLELFNHWSLALTSTDIIARKSGILVRILPNEILISKSSKNKDDTFNMRFNRGKYSENEIFTSILPLLLDKS